MFSDMSYMFSSLRINTLVFQGKAFDTVEEELAGLKPQIEALHTILIFSIAK